LLAAAMMNTRHRWNGTGVPTQSHPQAASLTLSAWNYSGNITNNFFYKWVVSTRVIPYSVSCKFSKLTLTGSWGV
jgi:hypothetical protein